MKSFTNDRFGSGNGDLIGEREEDSERETEEAIDVKQEARRAVVSVSKDARSCGKSI